MGKLFVIDGTDGSGKQTQLDTLKKRLTDEKIDYRTVSFPNYDSPSSSLVKMYLAGEFGTDAKAISPYIASTFYAADRYATYVTQYKEYYENGGIILADRYTTANMVHQAGKIQDKSERKKFLDWLWNFEFNLYGLPVPAEVFFLNMPPDISNKLIDNRAKKDNRKKDIHEQDKNYLEKCHEVYQEMANRYDWDIVECAKDNQLRTIEEIHEDVWQKIQGLIK